MPRAHSKPQTGGVAKVPVVMQMESLECGAACLAMVLAYYGRWVPLAQLREDSGVSRDGAKASNVLTAAEKYGMVAKGYRYGIENLKKRASYPCIIHWNFNHFVVLDGFRGNRAYLNDPGIGAYSVPMDEFDVSYTGICLLFSPGERFEPAGRQTSILSFARMRLKGSASVVAFVILTTVLVSVAGLVDPVILFVFVDEVLSGRNPDWLGPLCLIAGTIATLTLVTHWVKAAYTEKINGKFAVMASAEFFWHLMRLPMEFFSQRTSGDISTTQESNESIANTFIQTFGPAGPERHADAPLSRSSCSGTTSCSRRSPSPRQPSTSSSRSAWRRRRSTSRGGRSRRRASSTGPRSPGSRWSRPSRRAGRRTGSSSDGRATRPR
jgi:ABC-type bacteriocin/lantibiotic exporter with double-glycine peptidase domain